MQWGPRVDWPLVRLPLRVHAEKTLAQGDFAHTVDPNTRISKPKRSFPRTILLLALYSTLHQHTHTHTYSQAHCLEASQAKAKTAFNATHSLGTNCLQIRWLCVICVELIVRLARVCGRVGWMRCTEATVIPVGAILSEMKCGPHCRALLRLLNPLQSRP